MTDSATEPPAGDFFDEGMWPEYCNPLYLMPDEIQVKVTMRNEDGNLYDYTFPVGIEKLSAPKPYLGGYRNKLDGKIYHHAGSQTPKVNNNSLSNKKTYDHVRTRETQTVVERTVSVQLTRESGSQMQRPDLIIDTKDDVYIAPRPYFSSEELLALQIKKAIEIQRYYRGHLARMLAEEKRGRIRAYEQRLQDEAAEKARVEALQREEDEKRRLHPKTNDDFARLYNELDAWRKQEVEKVKSSTKANSDERTQAMNDILFNETQVLQSIRKLKVTAKTDMHEEKTLRMLDLMAQPHRWECSDGKIAYVNTPEISRSKELYDQYQALIRPVSNVDERLDILVHVKWTLGKHESALTKEAIDLINREADLLNRGRPINSMEGLRVRTRNLFLNFIEDPKYNPRAAEFTKMVGGSTATVSTANLLRESQIIENSNSGSSDMP